MNQTSLSEDLRPEATDRLDRVLSDFFKAQLPSPWAAAPTIATSEPSVLAATRTAARRDSVGKSRYTLAISAALLLGSCWYLSNGFAPSDRGPSHHSPTVGNPMLGGASAGNPAVLKEIRKDKAGKDTEKRPRIELP